MRDIKRYEGNIGSSLYQGTMLRNRYRIEKVLGQGGFGITYSALDTTNHYRVAVKELFPSRSVSRSEDRLTVKVLPDQENYFKYLRENFEKEARVLIDLQNLEGIVRLMHVFSENSTTYYVMELLEGEPLLSYLKRKGPMPWEQLAPILKTILMALEQIHSAGLIHRDVSPDNIFLTQNGARLIDFGSVRNYQSEANLTAVVKQNFAPWEQFLPNGHQGPWTDIYALSVTAYYSLCGQLPPPATERRVKDNMISLERLCPGLPQEVYAAIHYGMAVLPETRFHNVQQFRHALNLDEPRLPANSSKGKLVCLRGNFAGRSWYLPSNSALRIGRNTDCDICYPGKYPGVSRNQCTIYHTSDGRYMIKDDSSRYGTRLTSPGKNVILEPEIWHTANGAHIFFGAQEEYVLMR